MLGCDTSSRKKFNKTFFGGKNHSFALLSAFHRIRNLTPKNGPQFSAQFNFSKKGEKDTRMAGYDPLSRQLMLLEK